MYVIRGIRVFAFVALMGLSGALASAKDCSGLPTSFGGNQFPSGDFFSNFNNSCYTISLGTGYGSVEYGDLNAVYYQMFYQVNPKYQLILIDNFPNARYMSIALNDAHSSLAGSITDTNIVPLTSAYLNPFQPGVAYVAGQQFAVPINFGGTAGKEQTGCKMTGYNVDVNGLDATQRHPGMDYNTDSGFFQQYRSVGDHDVDTPQHTNPNTAGMVMMRAYVNDSPNDYADNPHIIVRDVASGCAYPAAYVTSTLGILTTKTSAGEAWMDQTQIQYHTVYDTDYLPKLCNASLNPLNKLRWSREPEYIPATNPDAAYVVAPVPANLATTLAGAGQVMRIRLQIPATPSTPCTNGCSRSGNEQMRYMSLSFVAGGTTMASIADFDFTKDPNGYATLIVGTGAAIPSWVTAANGYTYLDLTTVSGYQQLSLLALRHIIPSGTFQCATKFVPYRTSVDTPLGSLLGDYTPMVDYPAAASLPHQASPLTGILGCATFPLGEPDSLPQCGIFPAPVPSITSVVTECSAPGCNQFAAQSNPPITVVGTGFGVFPDGTPFTGTSKYLGIQDVTQGWYAGFTNDTCTISISGWDVGVIQFVANTPNANGKCKIKSNDTVKVKVLNPETLLPATYTVTAQ